MQTLIVITLLLLSFVSIPFQTLWAQNASKADSARYKLQTAVGERKIKLYIFIANSLLFVKPDSSIYYANLAIQEAENQGNNKFLADALSDKGGALLKINRYDEAEKDFQRAEQVLKTINEPKILGGLYLNYGSLYRSTGKYDAALDIYNKAEKLFISIKDSIHLSQLHNARAFVYEKKGLPDKSLEHDFSALKIQEKIGFRNGMSASLNGIASTYAQIGKHKEALVYFQRALNLVREEKAKYKEAYVLSNMAISFIELSQTDSAILYLNQAVLLQNEIQDRHGLAESYVNLSNVYLKRGDYSLATNFANQSIIIFKEIGNPEGEANQLYVLGNIGQKQNLWDNALEFYQKSLKLSSELGVAELEKNNCYKIYECYKNKGNAVLALSFHEKFQAATDSLNKKIQQKLLAEMQTKFDTENKEKQIELLNKNNELQSEKIGRQNAYILLAGVGLFLTLSLAGLMQKRNQENLRAKAEIEKQNHSLSQAYEEINAQKEHLDEINRELAAAYKLLEADNFLKTNELEEARKLQLSMLPQTTPHFPEIKIASFLKTAAEVGGDYYDFFLGQDQRLHFAVGDATGHGLRAAFLVAVAKSYFQHLAGRFPAQEILREISLGIAAMSLNEMFLALTLAEYKDGKLRLTGAAMPPAYVLRATGEVETLDIRGFYLGADIELPYDEAETTLLTGDCVVLLSDGLPETRNRNKELLGYHRLPQLLQAAPERSPEGLVAYLTEQTELWAGGLPYEDDLTLVVFQKMF